MLPRLLLAVLGVVMVGGCSLEYRPPEGSARERELIRAVIDTFHLRLSQDRDEFVSSLPTGVQVSWRSRESASPTDLWQAVRDFTGRLGGTRLAARALRVQIRQEGDLADAWVSAEWSLALASGQSAVFHPRALFVLTKEGGGWNVRSVRYDRDF